MSLLEPEKRYLASFQQVFPPSLLWQLYTPEAVAAILSYLDQPVGVNKQSQLTSREANACGHYT